jgi:hypothetical protein
MKDYAPVDFRHIVNWPIAVWQIVIASQNPDPEAHYFKGATALSITRLSIVTLSIVTLRIVIVTLSLLVLFV